MRGAQINHLFDCDTQPDKLASKLENNSLL